MPIKSIYLKPQQLGVWLKLEEHVQKLNEDKRRKKLSKADVLMAALDEWLLKAGSEKSGHKPAISNPERDKETLGERPDSYESADKKVDK